MKTFVRDGNLTGVAVTLALLAGIFLMAASMYFFTNQNIRILGASIGLAITAFGGYGARAKTIGLKPFDNTYKKAKDSYKEDDAEK
jgi:hypothetical protein